MSSSKQLRVFTSSHHMNCNIKLDSADASRSLMELLIEHKLPISSSCGGHGTCGTCRVFLEFNSPVTNVPPNAQEQEFWSSRGYPPTHPERLSCQILIGQLPPDCRVRLAE